MTRFRFYRQGLPFNSDDSAAWEDVKIPGEGVLTAVASIFQNANVQQQYNSYRDGRPDLVKLEKIRVSSELIENPDALLAWRVFKEISKTFVLYPMTLTFAKVLGFGGQGLVMKYDQLDDRKRAMRSVAVKRGITEDAKEEIEDEQEMMKNFVGARHIVQLVLPQADPNAMSYQPDPGSQSTPGGPSGRKRSRTSSSGSGGPAAKKVKTEDEDRPGVMVMECLENGDLANVIWLFVDKWDPDEAPLLGEHTISPRLKLGDFGLAKFITPGENTDQQFHLQWYEQFTVEWDALDPDTAVMPKTTAGNYRAHTNTWGIGLVMEMLITKCWPAQPPVAKILSHGGRDYATYGAHLLEYDDFDYVDENLRRIITLCLAHDPTRRPTLAQLADAALTHGAAKPSDLMTGDQLRLLFEP
ncbi:Uu.00g033490.m01.CDS01 [Anthostomella pinea]|uniref:Uu.00g033490.m01.CDS01 n=1 Tax=Anthostomella pinea TaxID=933095 RepID=A0AAI8V8V6_9PEZI|nr:Uu.00g033490.m01.CDS01 [Anthostomella pinea]